ncbi:hypothetical protein Pmani_027172 [Petrolisthes manimaculis]|uniref:G-protein coupled receptors family 1 profile domain-containing protein n=1 Tax=Petrolisthes manimaculis TaxID=1843537 RepID=A0AAE1P4L2_9EUCA|nr:hypothetical protein Pmani_027172 [Petrolisthes manimaculis]
MASKLRVSGVCKLTSYLEMSVVHASALSLLVISLERYTVIIQPLQAGSRCTPTKALAAIILIWTIAFISAGPLLWIIQYGHFRYVDGTKRPNCIMPISSQWAVSYIVSCHVIFFFTPLFLLVILYSVIARRLLMDTYELTHKKQTPQMRARKQVVIMMATVVFFFFLCLLPIRIFFIWIIAVPQETQSSLGMEGFYNILYFCRVMLYINSCINPILYNMTSTKFRNAFRRVFSGKRSGLRRQNTTYSNTSYNNPTVTNNIRLHYGANCSLVFKTVCTKTSGHHTYSIVSTGSATSQVTRQTSMASCRSRTPTRDTFV